MPENRLIPSVLRHFLSRRENGMLTTTQERLRVANIHSVSDVKRQAEPLVDEAKDLESLIREWRQFLHERVYQHQEVLRMASRGRQIVQGLFTAYLDEPELMPAFHAERASLIPKPRAVSDYLAGMTDRLAVNEYSQLFQLDENSDRIGTS